MTEKYLEAQMDVVEFPDVDIIATSDPAVFPEFTTSPDNPGDSFLE